MKNKCLSIAMIFAMMCSMIVSAPMIAYAVGDPVGPVSLDIAAGSIVIKADAYDFGTSANIVNSSNSYIITQSSPKTSTTNTITVQDNADVSITLENINISASTCALGIAAGSQVDLTLSGASYLQSGSDRAGLEVPEGAELVVSGTAADTLNVIGGDYASGIGGGRSSSGGSIVIKGGVITAVGGNAAGGTGAGAGIGGGRGASGGNITIEGGQINSTGGYRAAGIGGGQGGSSGIILIKDGDVSAAAAASSYSAGIGGGYNGKVDTITIEGGTITASGDDGGGIGSGRIQNDPGTTDGGTINFSGGDITASSLLGNGIGGGLLFLPYVLPITINITGGTIDAAGYYAGINSNEGEINISAGQITASSTAYGAGIGGAYGGRINGGTINISGGTIVAQGGSVGGAGIGGGFYGDAVDAPGSTINISGGDITANGGPYSAGIGGGYGTTAGEITITGGDITAYGNAGSAIGMGTVGWSGTGGGGKIIISQALVNASVENPLDATAINAGPSGSIYIGFAGEPSEWVCDPIDDRAEITFENSGFSSNGLVLGTCLIEGAGEIDGSYIEGDKQLADNTAPVLTAGTVSRISDTEATVKFTSDEAGEYYYEVVPIGSPQPDIDTSGSGTACDTTEQTISLDSLTAGAKYIYIVVKDAAGNVSVPLFMDIAAYIPADPGTIQFTASGHGTYEGYNGWEYVQRIGGSDGVVTVDYTSMDGTAIAGVHYAAKSGTLTWSDGDTDNKALPVTIYNDSIYNGYLNFSYVLSNPTGGADIGEQNPLTVQLSDNDDPPVPTGLKAKAGNKKVDLSWNPVNSAYYKLYYSTVDEEFTEDNSISVYEGESYTLTGLKNGTTYYFAVKAGHDIYYSDLSDTVSATPMASGGGGGGGGGYTPPVKEEPVEEDPQEPEITEPIKPVNFDDVPHDAWYKEAVDFISGRKIAAGIGDNKFGPDMELARGQFVVMLMNAFEISPQSTEDDLTVNFADAGNTYYTDYLLKARSLGIVSGVGEDLFAPDKAITRQEMSLMLFNALKVIDKLPAAAVDKEIDSFLDSEEIAEWAYEAMASLVKAGILSGSDDMLNPTATTSRAHMAQVLYKLLSK